MADDLEQLKFDVEQLKKAREGLTREAAMQMDSQIAALESRIAELTPAEAPEETPPESPKVTH